MQVLSQRIKSCYPGPCPPPTPFRSSPATKAITPGPAGPSGSSPGVHCDGQPYQILPFSVPHLCNRPSEELIGSGSQSNSTDKTPTPNLRKAKRFVFLTPCQVLILFLKSQCFILAAQRGSGAEIPLFLSLSPPGGLQHLWLTTSD